MIRAIPSLFLQHIKLICIGLFAFAILVGKAGFDDFLPQITGITFLNDIELRLPIVLFIGATLTYLRFSKTNGIYFKIVREQKFLLLWIGIVCLYLVGIWFHTMTGSPRSIIYLFAYCVLAAFLFQHKKDIIHLCWFMVGYIALIYAIVSIPGFEAGHLEDPVLGSSYSISRIGIIGACGAWVIALSTQSKKLEFLMWAVSIIFLSLASLSFERSVLLIFPVTIAFCGFFLMVRYTPHVFLKMAACTALSLFAMALVSNGAVFQRVIEHRPMVDVRKDAQETMETEIKRLCSKRVVDFAKTHNLTSGLTDRSCNAQIEMYDSDGRLRLYLHALKSSPGLFGHGMGKFLFLDGRDIRLDPYVHTYPHNIFFQIFYEGGYAGLALLLIATVYVFICIVRHIILSDTVYAPLFVLAVFYFCSSMVSGDIYDSRFLWIIPLIIGKTSILPIPSEVPSVTKPV